MTIFVIWQLIVTLDSIRNSCDVLFTDLRPWTDSVKRFLPPSGVFYWLILNYLKSKHGILHSWKRQTIQTQMKCYWDWYERQCCFQNGHDCKNNIIFVIGVGGKASVSWVAGQGINYRASSLVQKVRGIIIHYIAQLD